MNISRASLSSKASAPDALSRASVSVRGVVQRVGFRPFVYQCATLHCLRDPTRGGLASTLNEFAEQSAMGICIEEEIISVQDAIVAACDLLGFDPLYIANEGKLVAIVPEAAAEEVLAAMRHNRHATQAAIIGDVVSEHPEKVVMKTRLGASRIVDMLVGELLPRIC